MKPDDRTPVQHPALHRLLCEIAACRICRDAPEGGAGRRLPHEPRPVCRASDSAPILVASQAPGTRVHASGTPFTDASGDRLRAWLGVDKTMFYDTRSFAIVPMGFCFPGLDAKGGDLPPRRECAPAWRRRLLALMPQIRLVIAIGQYAQRYHIAGRRSLTETVADWRSIVEANAAPAVMPLPHPSWRNNAWIKRHPWFEAELLPELRARIRHLLELPCNAQDVPR